NREIRSKKSIPELCFALSKERLKQSSFTETKSLDLNKKEKLQDYLSNRAISVANDIHVTELIFEYIHLAKKDINKERKIILMKEIHEQISLAHLELSSMLGRLDCERDRAMQFGSYLDLLANKEIVKLTFYSLIIALTGTTLAAVVELAGGNASLSLGTDILFAGLAGYYSIQALNISVKGKFSHKSNLLKELNEKPQKPKLFFPSVWNFLVDETFAEDVSERKEILKIWNSDGSSKEDEKLFLSSGGIYTSNQIYKLVQRIDAIKTRMAFMNLELRQLQDELNDLENDFL
ncbi:MAG: hypothetical protein KDK36_21895, partial [Leptospiraceae bacterium]|nr:hypothetical protein [Leptospiraceae bacterium]